MEAVNLIKNKRCGKIKGRTCANGSKQKKYLKHGETISSPTLSLEVIIRKLIMDANERRYVAIVDVPGAYLQQEMPAEKLQIGDINTPCFVFVQQICNVIAHIVSHH